MTRLGRLLLGLTLAALPLAAAGAHDKHLHGGGEAAEAKASMPATLPGALPFKVGGPFDLVDHDGQTRGETDPEGQHQLLFFGYASCEAICDVALPRMAETVDLLEEDGTIVRPVFITVDPANDTPAVLKEATQALHPRMIGLTGSPEAVEAARQAFQVEASQVSRDIKGRPIYAHGSFIYLLAPDGEVLTLLPPVLGPDRMAEIVQKYL